MSEAAVVGTDALVKTLSDLLPPGGRVAVGDGAGFPVAAWPAVVDLLAARRDLHLLLGFCLATPARTDELDPTRVRTLVSGFGLRRPVDADRVAFVPVRLGTTPALLHGPLRADLLVTTLRPVRDGLAFSTEVSWQRAAAEAGARVAAVVNDAAPACESGTPFAARDVTVLAESAQPPQQLAGVQPTDVHREIAERVAALVPDGARLQVGPGGLGAAVYAALRRPVAVDTGLVTDPVVDLDRRGLVDGVVIAPYVTGTDAVYDWCAGRVRLAGVEVTHDPGRLASGRPLVAVNTGFEIDIAGQVNAESVGGSAIGGIGGQPDYAAAAATSRDGLSVVALSTRTPSGRSTLVRALQAPVTTPAHDVEVVVTERGCADLRGRSRAERAAALRALWDGAADE